MDASLKISQLLMAEGSPASPVYQENGPAPLGHHRQDVRCPVGEFQFHFWKQITAVEFSFLCLSHSHLQKVIKKLILNNV
jgi:hypothetical protein